MCGSVRAAYIVGALVLLLALQPAHAAPEEAYRTPLVVRADGLQLSSGVVAMSRGTEVYLPVRELALALEFAVALDPERARVEGWFLDPSRRYVIDARQRRVESEGTTHTVAPDAFLTGHLDDRKELFARPGVLERAWPVELSVSRADLALEVEPAEPLPIQKRRAREARRERLRNRGGPEQPDLPHQDHPYSWLGAPVVGIDIRARTGGGAGSVRESVRWAQEIAGVNVAAGVTASGPSFSESEVEDARLTLQRFAHEEPMPGGLERIAVGDVAGESIARIGSVGTGRGLTLSSFPLNRGSAYDRHRLEGDAPPGWEAELYRNGRLMDFQQVGRDGRYRFDGIGLAYGINRLHVVLYGPQGQTRERTEIVDVSQTQARPGATHARLDHIQDGRDFVPVDDEAQQPVPDPGTSLHVVHGISRGWSLETGFVSLPQQGQRPESLYTLVGAAGALGPMATRVRVLGQEPGGTGLDIDSQLRAAPVTLRFGVGLFDGFESPRVGFDAAALRGNLDMSVSAPVSIGDERLRLGARYELSETVAGTRTHQLDLSQRWNTGPVAWHHAVDYRLTDAGTDQWSATLDASDRWPLGGGDSLLWRAGIGYAQDVGATDGRLGARYRWSRTTTLGLNVRHTVAGGRTLGSIDATRSWDNARLSLTLEGGEGLENRLGLRYSIGFGPGGGNGYTLASGQAPRRGAIEVHAFVDRDGDGAFDAGEPPVEGARLQNPLRRGGVTDESGRLAMHDLEAHRTYPVRIDPASIEHPFWVPADKGREIRVRPGSVPVVELPVEATGSVSGTVRLAETGAEASGVPLRLVDRSGETVARTRSVFGGFFSFERVPYGEYKVRLDEARGYELAASTDSVVLSSAEPMASARDVAVEPRSTMGGTDARMAEADPGSQPQRAARDQGGETAPAEAGGAVRGTIGTATAGDPSPVGGVRVRLLDTRGQVIRQTRSGDDGGYRFEDIEPGIYRLVASGAGAATGSARRTVEIGRGGEVVDGVTMTVARAPGADTSAAERGSAGDTAGTIRGTVRTGPAGSHRPAAGLRVRLLDTRGQVIRQTRSGDDGGYRFEDIEPGTYRVAVARAGAAAEGVTRVVEIGRGGEVVDGVTMTVARVPEADAPAAERGPAGDTAGTIRGTVRTGPAGSQRPAAGLRVRLLDARGQVLQQAYTDDDGGYRFAGVEPGRFRVHVAGENTRPGGYIRTLELEPGAAATVAIDLPAGAGTQADAGDSTAGVDVLPAPGVIQGTVRSGAAGQRRPVAGVRVRLLDYRGQVLGQASSTDAGRYRFDGLTAGFYRVRVAAEPAVGETAARRVVIARDNRAARGLDFAVAGTPDAVEEGGGRGPSGPLQGTDTTPFAPERWLTAIPGGRYTIQLVGVSSEETARRFIARHGLTGRAVYVRTTYDGHPWFPVLHGGFANRAAARAARDDLPAALEPPEPWVRHVGGRDSAQPGADAGDGVQGRKVPGSSEPAGWVLAQPPSRYTIQLMGAHSEQSVQAYIERHGLTGRAIYVRSRYRGEPWFPLLYGTFATRQAARNARQDLPSDLQSESPWVRSFRDIQANIREASPEY